MVGFRLCFAFAFVMHLISCHHVHRICIRVRPMHPRIFPLFILHSSTPMSSGVPFCLFSRAGIKHPWIGPRLAKRPWYTTGRLPVKFRVIRSPFDTPTVNRGTVKASCVLQPNTPPKWPKTHLNPLHPLGRSITIAWPKTALHLESPSSLYL